MAYNRTSFQLPFGFGNLEAAENQRNNVKRALEKERKIAPLYKLVLEVIPHIIKNQLTLYEQPKKKSQNAKMLFIFFSTSHLSVVVVIVVRSFSTRVKEMLDDAANKIKKTH